MRRFINPLLLWLAHADHADLIRQVQYLKVENEILRKRLPKMVVVTRRERQRLVRYARQVGPAIAHLISIVTPCTMYRWLRGLPPKVAPKKPGRPRLPEHIEQVILRIARETGWGYTRILGELRKLGFMAVSRSTVVNILRRAGLDPSPQRKKATWDTFIKRHAETLWACDMMQRKVLTLLGWRYAWVLVFINVKSRLAWVSPSTRNPDSLWTGQQTSVFMRQTVDGPHSPRIVMHDRDARFGWPFKIALRFHGAKPQTLPLRSPNLNAYVERFIQTLQQECLDHFLIFGTSHLDHLLKEFLEHYHAERPHQSRDNLPLTGCWIAPARASPVADLITCQHRLGGLLKHYRVKNAA